MANRIITAAATGETTVEEAPDAEIPAVEEAPQPTVEQLAADLKETMVAVMQLSLE